MAEARGTERVDPAVELDRIEAALATGNTDVKTLGFWRVVARVKPDPVLVDRYADRIGAIDHAAFAAGVKVRAPVWLGNIVLSGGIVAGGIGVAIAHATPNETLSGFALIGAAIAWSVSFHCPAHWAVGRLVGIQFTDYFLGGPPPPRPGLKTDYATYLRADPSGRAWMHAAGAIATKLAPFLALAFWPASRAPWWSALVLLGLGVLQIATDVLFSVKSSDWKRFLRERRVAGVRGFAPEATSILPPEPPGSSGGPG